MPPARYNHGAGGGGRLMKAEIEAITGEIGDSLKRLRRHL
jgi:hypothetical protein